MDKTELCIPIPMAAHNAPVTVIDNFACYVTDPGLRRSCNEDSVGIQRLSFGGETATLVVVADGIGGHQYGDVASQTCLSYLMEAWVKLHNETSQLTLEAIKCFYQREVTNVNAKIYEMNRAKNLLNPMGTTLVSGIYFRDALVTANLGDSRAYRVRCGRITRLTHDHSYISDMISNRVITEKEAEIHPFSHVINRSVGIHPFVETEYNTLSVQAGDRYIFCSDGAILYLDDFELEAIMYDSDSPSEIAMSLLNRAIVGGGEDNITAAVIAIPEVRS